jgi:hypothetical protein
MHMRPRRRSEKWRLSACTSMTRRQKTGRCEFYLEPTRAAFSLTMRFMTSLRPWPQSIAPLRRGDVLAMRPLLVHASSKSQSHKPRRVLHFEYITAEAFESFALAIA